MLTRDINAESVEYDAILASALFAGETNSKRFLRFVCDKHFAGIQNVTEYEIGVEALGRRADFDPGEDSIVRVEAHRIRKRLREYYAQEGSKHTLWLVIPHGSYMPQFVPAGQAGYESHDPGSHGDPARLVSPAGTPALAQKGTFGKYRALLLALICIVISIAGFEFYTRLHAGQRDNAPKGAAVTVPSMAATSPDVLIMAGSTAGSYTDQLGHVWASDRFFDGGESSPIRYRRILRTGDPQLYLTARQGEDFGYDIPIQPGFYELRLYFAETTYGEDNPQGGGEASRMFDVIANGMPILTRIDPLSDAGGSNVADVRAFARISPGADGKLHLRFVNHFLDKGVAFVNAIQLTRTDSKQMLPVRLVSSNSAVVDRAGRLWVPDQYVQGGQRRERAQVLSGTDDPGLYKSERFGNFSYAVPVVGDASYTLTLYFAEQWYGTPDYGQENNSAHVGDRVFDVYCNGISLLQDFDIYKEAGGTLKAVTRTFHGLRPNHQGKLLLSFVPNRDYATLNALEIVQESKK